MVWPDDVKTRIEFLMASEQEIFEDVGCFYENVLKLRYQVPARFHNYLLIYQIFNFEPELVEKMFVLPPISDRDTSETTYDLIPFDPESPLPFFGNGTLYLIILALIIC